MPTNTGQPRKLFAYVCPYCGRQYRGPGGHHTAGDDLATSCFHGEISQPQLEKIDVYAINAEPELVDRIAKVIAEANDDDIFERIADIPKQVEMGTLDEETAAFELEEEQEDLEGYRRTVRAALTEITGVSE